MDIEILTVKKKLTKSLLNQMRFPSLEVLRYGEPLGYLINIIKDNYQAILIKHKLDYYIISTHYKKGEILVCRKTGQWSQIKKFETTIKCDDWWKAYQRTCKLAKDQIYV